MSLKESYPNSYKEAKKEFERKLLEDEEDTQVITPSVGQIRTLMSKVKTAWHAALNFSGDSTVSEVSDILKTALIELMILEEIERSSSCSY